VTEEIGDENWKLSPKISMGNEIPSFGRVLLVVVKDA